MPISSFYGLQTSLRGLIAQQRLLDTTGHNIANASTAGYSRQRVNLSASPALQVTTASGLGSLGSGVDVDSYTRVRDQFLDIQYRAQASGLSSWTSASDSLGRVEDALQEPSDTGLSNVLEKFWSAWSALGNAPSEPAAKQAVVEAGNALADGIGTVHGQIRLAKDQAYQQYQSLAAPAGPGDPGGDVAQVASQIAQLNATIKRSVAAGDSPNDLLDRRDQLLDQLAGYGQISVTDRGDGSIDVDFVDTAAPATTYSVVSDTAATWAGPPTGDSWSPGGQLGGLLQAGRDGGTLDGYLSTLDDLATAITSAVNTAYQGTFFTTGGAGTSPAATLQVESSLAGNPGSLVSGSGGSGTSDLARAVAALADTKITDPSSPINGSSIGDAYASFVAKVGANSQEATRQQANAQALVSAVDSRRQSISGVSLDEEMTNLIQFQRGYQASARAMSTIDDMLDVLINRTGRVGL